MNRSKEIEYITNYYNDYDEEGRLLRIFNSLEYITTMKYIKQYLRKEMKILEIGAGTGRYSLTLAEEGYRVDAVDLVQHNIDIFKSKMKPNHKVTIKQGDACNLDYIKDNTYDITLLLGPMYHLYHDEDKLKALSEAIRVTKSNGVIFVAYCGNDAVVYDYIFRRDNLRYYKENNYIDDNFHTASVPEFIIELYRKEDVDRLMANFNTKRLHYVGTDMISRFIADEIDNMDSYTFENYVKFHLQMCERNDMVGLSTHMLDVFRKEC